MAVLSTLNGDVQSLMDAYLWGTIHLDAPIWWLHPMFMTLWDDEDAFDQICEAAPSLTFAPGLREVLDSPTPPTLEYFRSLPEVVRSEWRKHWVIYAHIYEHEGRKPRLYIGSATAQRGATPRLAVYEKTIAQTLPRFVKKAITQGFRKTRTALLAWSDIPLPGVFLKARQRYLGIEGIFQMLFFASIFDKYEPEWADFMPWCRKDVEWEPLCSHVSLSECGKGDFSLSTEELEFLHAIRLKNRRRQKNLDNLRYRVKWKASRPSQRRANRLAVKATRKHECTTCKMTFGCQSELTAHLRRGLHKNNVEKLARGEPIGPKPEAVRRAKLMARNVAQRRFHCDVCDHDFQNKDNLNKHYLTARHSKAAAIADAELDNPDLDYESDSGSDADRDELDAEALDTDLDDFQVSDED
ncbi:hypothetical protein HBI42_137100 [Parastagonospora nodorum]|nr:hypothetical protein HBI43_136480 [Parastagonospora nodorum]KAH6253720.1 hypothetical protein HBI42_137100 [Parastagonospora nodorum]